MASYYFRPPQELHPLSLLAQSASRRASGCLRVIDGTRTWQLFLEKGALVYAAHSGDPFGRLDRHLRRLSHQIPGLVNPVRVQVRTLFEKPMTEMDQGCKDYEAICWLVDQQYLTNTQAAELIEVLAKEVLETFLPLRYGNYDWLEIDPLRDLPTFCQLDLRSLVETCQIKPMRRSSAPPTSSSSGPPKAPIPPISLREPATRELGNPQRQPGSPVAPSTGSHGTTSTQPLGFAPRSTYTIACIDDSPTVLRAIESFLDDKAFRVLQIENPVSALMQVIRNKPDLILLDVTMPNLDGYELCSLLRRHPSFKQTPIIMVTGNRGLIDRAKAKLVGASGYLTKPFTQPDLLKIVFKHLS